MNLKGVLSKKRVLQLDSIRIAIKITVGEGSLTLSYDAIMMFMMKRVSI